MIELIEALGIKEWIAVEPLRLIVLLLFALLFIVTYRIDGNLNKLIAVLLDRKRTP